ncbi:conserved hypothetical protein [uncultured Gammaproteobacteria bacterium]
MDSLLDKYEHGILDKFIAAVLEAYKKDAVDRVFATELLASFVTAVDKRNNNEVSRCLNSEFSDSNECD